MKRWVAMAALAPLVAGCVWIVAGTTAAAGAFVWVKGNLTRTYQQPLETAWEGSLHALRVLKVKIDEQKHDALNGYIEAKMARGSAIRVTLARLKDNQTKITVRVGALGDRAISERVHEEIGRALR